MGASLLDPNSGPIDRTTLSSNSFGGNELKIGRSGPGVGGLPREGRPERPGRRARPRQSAFSSRNASSPPVIPANGRHGADSEPELIARVLQGDPTAFRPLVETYERTVFALCRKLLDGSEAEAEDVSQEAFLRAYRRLPELKDPQRFAPWLYQIARSLCRESHRRRRAERRALERRQELERQEAAGRGGEKDDIGSVVAALPPGERQALELKYFEGLPYREIARRMGLTFAQVDHLIRQARERLSRRIRVARRERERSL